VDPFGLEIRVPTPEEKQKINNVIYGLGGYKDSGTLRRTANSLARRNYFIDTSLKTVDPSKESEMGYVYRWRSDNNIYISIPWKMKKLE